MAGQFLTGIARSRLTISDPGSSGSFKQGHPGSSPGSSRVHPGAWRMERLRTGPLPATGDVNE